MKRPQKVRASADPVSRKQSAAHKAAPVAQNRALIIAAILAAVAVAHLRCLGNGWVFDDASEIVDNRYIGNWSFFWKSLLHDSWWFLNPAVLPQSSYYRPLQNIWFGLHYHLFGLNPAPWHATMVAMDLLVVWLVFKVAERLTRSMYAGAVAALMFGLMPIHAEAVVWASAIPLPLGAAFELAALYLFITRAEGVRRWPLALVLFGAALLTHESAVTLPAIIAGYAFLLESPEATVGVGESQNALSIRIRGALALAAPFAAEVAAYLLLRWLVLGFIARANPLNHATNAQVAMTIPRVIVADLLLLAFPWIAGPSHRLMLVTSALSPQFYLSLAALTVIAAAFLLLIRKSPRRRLYLFCAIWIGISIAPMMNLRGLFQQELVQDRYLYVASVGWCLMVADWAIRMARRATLRPLIWMGATAMMATYAIALWNVQAFWHDDLALYTGCVEKFPESAIWRRMRASALERRGDLRGAADELQTSHSLDPDDAKTLYRLAVVDMQLGKIKEATEEAADSLRINPHPLAGEYILLAKLYDKQGDEAKKEEILRRAESLPDGKQSAAIARAQMMMAHGDARGAEEILRQLVHDYPNDLMPRMQLGLSLSQQKYAEAMPVYDDALRLSPNDASTNLLAAMTLHAMGRDAEALQHCRQVLSVVPDDANAHALMAAIVRGSPTR